MDKYEFKLKVDEMKALVSARNYNAAAEIAETINWRKIRNLNALVLAGEVFEQVERYEESKENSSNFGGHSGGCPSGGMRQAV